MKRSTLVAIVIILAVGTLSLNYLLLQFEDEWKPNGSESVPQSVVSTSPAITEMLFALGVQERIVGVTDFCTFPSSAQSLPKIGGIVKPNFEQILALKPDLVLLGNLVAWMQPEFERAGLATLLLTIYTVQQILDSFHRIGSSLDLENEANELVNALELQISRSKIEIEGKERRSVMMVVGRSPGTLNDLYVVGGNVFLNDLISFAGARNIFGNLPLQYAKISIEEIISRAPEIIIESAHTIDLDQRRENEMKRAWRQLSSLPAVKNDQIYILNDEYLLIPGPRFVKTLKKFKDIFHPKVTIQVDRL